MPVANNPCAIHEGLHAVHCVDQCQACEIAASKYHRISPKITGGYLPIQKYAASMVRDAMEKRKTIILMRSRAQWLWLVPDLEKYEKLLKLNNPQSP